MRKLILCACVALVTAGCPDFSGLEEVSAYSEEILDAARVVDVACEADTLAVGEAMQCVAFGPTGADLSTLEADVVYWGTSDRSVARVGLLDGIVFGQGAGTAVISATGPDDRSVGVSVTVR